MSNRAAGQPCAAEVHILPSEWKEYPVLLATPQVSYSIGY